MKKLTLLLVSIFTVLISFAGEVTEEQALVIAQQFMRGKQFKQKNLHRTRSVGDTKSFYIFNVDKNGGFIIVSADDRTVPILGYASEGNMDVDQLPENVKKWLEGYDQQIKALVGSHIRSSVQRRAIGSPIAPLLTTHWGQEPPYNSQCPMDGETRCVTGCIATVMAQIMNYYKWPETAVGPFAAYTTSTQSIPVPELPATTFKWDKMKDTYKYGEEGEAADAVAELMRYCGQAVTMDYTAHVSGSALRVERMSDCFGFDKNAYEISRSNFTTEEWEEIIYHELENKRPVAYVGIVGVGHQYLVDGYDGNGLFHVNWGWWGMYDGYYALSVLNPYESLLGANGWNMGQAAIIGLQPDNGKEDASPKIYSRATFSTDSYTRTGTEDFSISVDGSYGSWAPQDLSIDYRWVICKDGAIIKEFEPQQNAAIKMNEWYEESKTLSFGASVENGEYELRQMYRLKGSDVWQYCAYYNDPNIIILTVSGTTLTLKNASELTDTYQINNVEFSGTRKTFRGMKAIVNWTNKGYRYESPFYLWDNRDWPIGEVSSYANHNETVDVVINFPGPETAGDVVHKITTDYAGTNVIWTGTPLAFEESLEQNITGKIVISGGVSMSDAITGFGYYMIEGTTVDAIITLKNEGQYAYNDIIYIEMYQDKDGESEKRSITKELTLDIGEEKTFAVQFTDLIVGQRYGLRVDFVQLYAYANQVNWSNATATSFEAKELTSVNDIESDMKPVEIYNLQGQRIGAYQKGLNIIRMGDAKTQKVLVR